MGVSPPLPYQPPTICYSVSSAQTGALGRCAQVAQLEEYMKTLDMHISPLSDALDTMMECNEVKREGHGVGGF